MPTPQIRALWIDAFQEGLKTPEQIDHLIATAHAAHINTLIPQVRRRADAYFLSSVEPRTEDPAVPAGFDPLGYLLEQAHARGMEIHAWGPVYPAWRWDEYPKNPAHPWNVHGPKASGRADWSTYTFDGESTFYFDPGHPDVPDHLTSAFMEMIRRYPVDGIHLDYIRYDERGYGYNPTALERFAAQTGRTDRPALNDPQWRAWRRHQVTQMVRRLYLEAIAIRPSVKVTAAVITWGDPPNAERPWEQSSPYVRTDQDWRAWLEEGILDLAYPMNYFREYRPEHRQWLNDWLEFEKDHQYGRQIAPGPGIFLNYVDDGLAQVERALAPSQQGNRAAGFALYCWGGATIEGRQPQPEQLEELPRKPHPYDPGARERLFAELGRRLGGPAPIPPMPWKEQPEVGYIAGKVPGCDSITVTADGPVRWTVQTDATGWFGFTNLPPGRYTVEADGLQRILQVEPGRVVRF